MTLSILLVDDEEEKIQAVREGIGRLIPDQAIHITVATDAAGAKRAMKEHCFDVVILDVALPTLSGGAPEKQGGIKLLEEVMHRQIYHKPQHVVGLTGYTDVFELSGSAFSKEMWSLLFYDRASDVWLEQLVAKLRHIAAASASKKEQGRADICIVVAVDDEFRQVKGNGWDWHPEEIEGDATIYLSAAFKKSSGGNARAMLAKAPLMGMSSASVLATKMGYLFRPRCIIMAGICAGDSEQVSLGDLIVPDPVWDYGSGKYIGDVGPGSFEPAPYQHNLYSRVRGVIDRFEADAATLAEISAAFLGARPPTTLKLHRGPFASGAAVVADRRVFERVQAKQHRKLLGIDMEAYGVMSASVELPAPQPDCLVIKGVSDFADKDKGDSCRHYAAFVSARAVTVLCEQYNL